MLMRHETLWLGVGIRVCALRAAHGNKHISAYITAVGLDDYNHSSPQ